MKGGRGPVGGRAPTMLTTYYMYYLWLFDDSYITMGRYTCIHYWNSSWSKRYNRDNSNISVAHFAVSHFNTSNRTLVHLVQWTFLLVCVASIRIKNNLTLAYVLMAGVALSRLGLWMFDLSVIQLMQVQDQESDRQDFWELTLLSFSLVTLAAALYNIHIHRVRNISFTWRCYMHLSDGS